MTAGESCRRDLSVLYQRAPPLFGALALARGDGRYGKLLKSLSGIKLLILDDWGPEILTAEQARDLLEIVEDRFENRSMLVTSQAPVDRWHEMIGNPTLADAGSSTTPTGSNWPARASAKTELQNTPLDPLAKDKHHSY